MKKKITQITTDNRVTVTVHGNRVDFMLESRWTCVGAEFEDIPSRRCWDTTFKRKGQTWGHTHFDSPAHCWVQEEASHRRKSNSIKVFVRYHIHMTGMDGRTTQPLKGVDRDKQFYSVCKDAHMKVWTVVTTLPYPPVSKLVIALCK